MFKVGEWVVKKEDIEFFTTALWVARGHANKITSVEEIDGQTILTFSPPENGELFVPKDSQEHLDSLVAGKWNADDFEYWNGEDGNDAGGFTFPRTFNSTPKLKHKNPITKRKKR